jgi:hypothetical protein
MKRPLFFLLLFNLSFAQVPYSNYWDNTSEWRYFSAGFDGVSGFILKYRTIYFDGYQNYNGQNYYRTFTKVNEVHNGITTTTLTGPFLRREDATGKFYSINANTGLEQISFDNQIIINAQIGDAYPYDNGSCTVQQIDTKTINGTILKHVKGSLLGENYGVLEGVGFVGNSCALGYEHITYLNCYTKQGATLQLGPEDCSLFPTPYRTFLGTNTNALDKILTFYPNPVHNTLKITNNNNLKIKSINIVNYLGQIVLNENNPSETIDISTLASGNYLLKINTDNGTLTQKLIKN